MIFIRGRIIPSSLLVTRFPPSPLPSSLFSPLLPSTAPSLSLGSHICYSSLISHNSFHQFSNISLSLSLFLFPFHSLFLFLSIRFSLSLFPFHSLFLFLSIRFSLSPQFSLFFSALFNFLSFSIIVYAFSHSNFALLLIPLLSSLSFLSTFTLSLSLSLSLSV